MARYFSEQTLLEMRREGMYEGYDLYDLEDFLSCVPTADVVPKSDVERLENTYRRAFRKIDNETITAIRNARREVAREIFEEIEKIIASHGITIGLVFDEAEGASVAIGRIDRKISELKEKYTEGGE